MFLNMEAFMNYYLIELQMEFYPVAVVQQENKSGMFRHRNLSTFGKEEAAVYDRS
jgi:hypothetical protein